MLRAGSRPVYLVAEACLAVLFPRIPQCPGVHTSETLLYTDSSFRAQTVSATWAEFTLVLSLLSALPGCQSILQLTHYFYNA